MNVFRSAMAHTAKPSFAELYMPKLVTVLREGYTASGFRSDVVAGLTVAIVALPLSMAIAIASGVTPDRGLFTAIVGGFIISAIGGSRFQIGGPAGAFIVLVAASVAKHGVEGVILATLMSGVMLLAIGYLRLGTYIKFIPHPVTVGFTSGIAVIIFASQIKELLGLTLAGREPGDLIPKLATLGAALHTTNFSALALAVGTIVVIVGLKHWKPHWPGMLIAVSLAAVATFALGLDVSTIGTRFGGIPRTLPMPSLPAMNLELAQEVLPDAIAFTLLGAIESLLSAVVADGMTGRRHRSNCELVAQGFGNVASAIFGGICVTGTIARTATNVRAGARGPISGMLHALFLLLFMLVAAPLASYIPLATLAGVLAVVSWNMAEKHAFWTLIRQMRGDALVLLATFGLTVFRDLTEGILVGFSLGALLFLNRMTKTVDVEHNLPPLADDIADDNSGVTRPYDPNLVSDPNLVIYRISGAFFFGTASTVGMVLDRIADYPKNFILDFSAVPFLDSTAATTIEAFAHKAERHHVNLIISGAAPPVRHELWVHGVRPPKVKFRANVQDARDALNEPAGEDEAPMASGQPA